MVEQILTSATVEYDWREKLNQMNMTLADILKRGDKCLYGKMGVKSVGKVKSVIRLSNGSRLFSITAADGELPMGLFEEQEIEPVNPVMRAECISAFECNLRRYEPKGMTTAH